MATQLYFYPLNKFIPPYFRRKSVDKEKINKSSTVYVGNLSFFTTETQIYDYFSTVGLIDEIIFGKNGQTDTFCGFCFVVYFRREDALAAVICLNNSNGTLQSVGSKSIKFRLLSKEQR